MGTPCSSAASNNVCPCGSCEPCPIGPTRGIFCRRRRSLIASAPLWEERQFNALPPVRAVIRCGGVTPSCNPGPKEQKRRVKLMKTFTGHSNPEHHGRRLTEQSISRAAAWRLPFQGIA
jgi:hypothetical protein